MPRSDPFGFIAPQKHRESNFWTALNASNSWHHVVLGHKRHIFEHKNKRDQAFDARGWMVGHIMEAFSGDEGAKRREVKGIDGIVFDDTWFLYFRLIDDPENPPSEPKTIVEARRVKNQLRLDLGYAQEKAEQIPFHDLHFILGGYVRNDGFVTGLFFIDQSVEPPLVRELSSLSSTQTKREVNQPPKPKFVSKSDLNRSDKVE